LRNNQAALDQTLTRRPASLLIPPNVHHRTMILAALSLKPCFTAG
jgi:hypothetical protein